MLSTDYLDAVCELKTLKNDLILTGRIRRITAEGVEIYDPPHAIPIIAMDTPVKIEAHKAGLDMKVLAGRVYISNRLFVRVVDVVNYADYEQRRYFRLDIDHSATLFVPRRTADGEEVEVEKVPVRVRNISLCGMLFECERDFQKGRRFELEMALFNNKPETLNVVVRRIQRPERGQKVFYGMEIVELSSRAERNLCAFLFREQQEQIRRTRERQP